MGYSVKEETVKDWVRGRVSIPLVAIEHMVNMNGGKHLREYKKTIKYVCSSTQETTRIPQRISDDLLYLCGLIAGDGCIPYTFKEKGKHLDYSFDMISGDREFLDNVYDPLLKKVFEINTQKTFFHNRAWISSKSSKPTYRFLTRIMGIPRGKKSKKLRIPKKIKALKSMEAIPFIAGLIDTDIGKHSKGMGGTFRSGKLVDDLIAYFKSVGITAKSSGLHYKDNIYLQYDFRIPKGEIRKLYKLLASKYVPRRRNRLETIIKLAGVA